MELSVFKDQVLNEIFRSSPNAKLVEQLVINFFSHKPLPIVNSHHKFLGRCRPNFNNKIYKNVSEVSYNPNKDEVKLQRCNTPGQQLFYGALPTISDNASLQSTALMEVCLEYIRDEEYKQLPMTFSRWQIKRPLTVVMLPHSLQAQQRNPDFKEAGENFSRVILNAFADNLEAANYFITSLEFMSDVFCKLDDKKRYYLISSAFFNFAVNAAAKKGIKLNGIIYPSANTEAAGVNIALTKDVVDQNWLECDRVLMYEIYRDLENPKYFTSEILSEDAIPDSNRNFTFTFFNP